MSKAPDQGISRRTLTKWAGMAAGAFAVAGPFRFESHAASSVRDAALDPAAAWIQYRVYGSAAAREILIEHYRYMVPKTRQRIVPTCLTKIAPEDLDREGLVALGKTIDWFDPSRGVKFESYAISMVRGGMLEYLRKHDWVPRSARTRQRLLARAEDALTAKKGAGAVTDEDRAAYLGLAIDPPDRLEAAIMQIATRES